MWNFFNTSAGLVILSSVFIGGLGKLYVDYKSTIAERAAISAEKANLISEIRIRSDELTPAIEKLAVAEYAIEKSGNVRSPLLEACFSKTPYFSEKSELLDQSRIDVLRNDISQIVHGSSVLFTGHPIYKDTHLKVLFDQLDRLNDDNLSSKIIEINPNPSVFDNVPTHSKYISPSAGSAALLMDVNNVCHLHLYHQEIMRYVMARSESISCTVDQDTDKIVCRPK